MTATSAATSGPAPSGPGSPPCWWASARSSPCGSTSAACTTAWPGGRGLALLGAATVLLAVTLALVARRARLGRRAGAALAVGAVVWTWGVAQYPYLLPFDLTIDAGAAASVTMRWVLLWFLVALVTAGPALVLLYVLGQRGEIAVDGGVDGGDGAVTPRSSPSPRAGLRQ